MTPAHSTGTSIAQTSPRPLESSGPMPPWNTGKPCARIALTSRTSPSVTQPTPPRAMLAVVRSSPQGAIRPDAPQASTATSPGLRSSISAISRA